MYRGYAPSLTKRFIAETERDLNKAIADPNRTTVDLTNPREFGSRNASSPRSVTKRVLWGLIRFVGNLICLGGTRRALLRQIRIYRELSRRARDSSERRYWRRHAAALKVQVRCIGG